MVKQSLAIFNTEEPKKMRYYITIESSGFC